MQCICSALPLNGLTILSFPPMIYSHCKLNCVADILTEASNVHACKTSVYLQLYTQKYPYRYPFPVLGPIYMNTACGAQRDRNVVNRPTHVTYKYNQDRHMQLSANTCNIRTQSGQTYTAIHKQCHPLVSISFMMACSIFTLYKRNQYRK